MFLSRSRHTTTWLVFVALSLLAACSGNQAASEPPPTPEPETQQPATPQPTSTAVPATATPEPTPTATPVPTVAPPPTTTATGVSFQPVTPGVGPYDYPDIGLDQVTSNPLADVVWTVVELSNAAAQMAAQGSSDNILSWTNLVNLEWIAPGFVDEATGVDWSDPSIAQTGEDSRFSEMTIGADDGLVVTMCAHNQMIEDGSSRDVTMIQTYRFQTQGASFQLYGYAQEPVNQNEFVSCEL